MLNTTTIHSSHGEIKINNQTGKVLSIDVNCTKDCDTCINGIKKFDLKEYCEYYSTLTVPDNADILDFGYWKKVEGKKALVYEEPAHDWRKEWRKLRPNEILLADWDAQTDEKKKEICFSLLALSQVLIKTDEIKKNMIANQGKIIVNLEGIIAAQEGMMVSLNEIISTTQKHWDAEKEIYSALLVDIANEIAKGGDMNKIHSELMKFIKLEAGAVVMHTGSFSA